MKKTSKILAVVLSVILVVAAVSVLVACGDNSVEGVAYGVGYNNQAIVKATVTVKNGEIVNATIEEAMLIDTSYARASSDKVSVHGTALTSNRYWKKISWGDVTAEWDDSINTYLIGTLWLNTYIHDSEDNCKAYFEAVATNNLVVKTAFGDSKTSLTSNELLKSKNDYWTINDALGWKGNVEATVQYVIENGFDNATFSTNSTTQVWEDANNKSTGATWTDMSNYVDLLKTAYDRAVEATAE